VRAQRIGVLGGTFDPVHNAHLDLALLFLKKLDLASIHFLPAGSPWQKTSVGASAPQRVAMLKIALQERGIAATIDERELRRAGPSYTVDSLREIRAELGWDAQVDLLIGADQLLRLHTWSRWQEIFTLANLAVGGRPHFALQPEALDPAVSAEVGRRQVNSSELPAGLNAPMGQIALIPADLGDTSSSAVRESLSHRDFESVRHLIPSKVLRYIRQNNLYAPP
jgi:nicotinate-nucleotide adenylyltransferase